MRTSHSPRGLTLIEIMVAVAVSAVVLTGIVSVVNTQQKAFYDGQRQRQAQASARAALLFIEQKLLLAGYGMDAPLAFDFDRYSGPCPEELQDATSAGCVRDRTDDSDEIVFYNRNPQYWVPSVETQEPVGNAWRIVANGFGSNLVKINARAGDVFYPNQIVQMVCPAGSRYVYGTVFRKAAPTADGELTLNLRPLLADNPFRNNNAYTIDGCFTGGQARLFKIERNRFHVRPVTVNGRIVPYLVFDGGLDVDGDGAANDTDDELIVAEGIEILQFGYAMTNAALAPRGTVPGVAIAAARGAAAAGATSGTALTLLDFPGTEDSTIFRYGPTSFYGYTFGPPAHANRLTDHQGNIRAVRVAIVARSPDPDPSLAGREGDIALPVLNLDTLPAWIDVSDRYARARFDTTVPIRNMAARAMTDF
jgi:type IV pilus assembly protein PilW